MTRAEESQIQEILRKHIEQACAEIGEANIHCGYWPHGCSGRFAEILTQAIGVMASENAE